MKPNKRPVVHIDHPTKESEPEVARKSRAPTAHPRSAKAAASRTTAAIRAGVIVP